MGVVCFLIFVPETSGWSSQKFVFLLIRIEQLKQDVQRCLTGRCLILIFLSQTAGPIGTKLGRNVYYLLTVESLTVLQDNLTMSVGYSHHHSVYWMILWKVYIFCRSELHKHKVRLKIINKCHFFLIFFSETTGQIGTKLDRHVHWVVL